MIEKTEFYKLAMRMRTLNEGKVFMYAMDNNFMKELITTLNTDNQLQSEHVDSLGRKLFNNYTQRGYYGKGDSRAGQPYEVYSTGEFYDSFRVRVFPDRIEIDSNHNKDGVSLFEMYTPEIVGLTEQSKEIVRGFIREFVVKYVREFIIQ